MKKTGHGAQRQRWNSRLSVGLLALILGAGGVAPVWAQAAKKALVAEPQEVDRIVAVVNGDVITRSEFVAKVAQIQRQLSRQGMQMPPADVLNKQVLERMVMEQLQLQQARENGIRVDEGMLDRAVGVIAQNNKLSIEQLREQLQKDGVAWSRFREEIRSEILLTRIREREVDSRIQISDAEADNFLANEANASTEEFLMSHILLRAPDQASPEQLAKLQVKADGILKRLQAGEDFAKLAASYSDAPDAMSGGNLGVRTLDRMPSLFSEVVVALKPGEVSQVLRSSAGFHIVKVVDRKGGALLATTKVTQTHARHILIKTSQVVSDKDAQQKLKGLLERIRLGGASFAELAKVHSADLSAAKGGDLGWLYPGDTVPEFEKAMNALKPGEVSEPIQSPFGWHLIMVDERRDQDVSEDRKRQMAKTALRERKIDEAYQDWLRQLRDRAYVDYRLEER